MTQSVPETAAGADAAAADRHDAGSRGSVIPGGRLRLRTLVTIRWSAVAGQTTTVLLVHYGFGFPVPLLACIAVIATSAVSNLILVGRRSGRVRLGDADAAFLLGFDVMQLATLLYLTGGVLNPFAILIIGPLMVSATLLSRGATVALTLLALTVITFLAFHHEPLPWAPNAPEPPLLYALGLWTALAVASVFISAYVWSVAEEARRMSDALAEAQAALAREQQMSALGGLAAAAAHELGSPLATISVVARELSREIAADSPHAEDVALLQSQADRCAEILRNLSRRPEASGGEPYERMSLGALIETAAAPYRTERVDFDIETTATGGEDEPIVARSPMLLHGLGNLLQNAMHFAESRVEVDLFLSGDRVTVTIRDDGPGFPPGLLGSIGEPYISVRPDGGQHMGLGIFIAQTLLERTGAGLSFRNDDGAEVVISWQRVILEALKA